MTAATRRKALVPRPFMTPIVQREAFDASGGFTPCASRTLPRQDQRRPPVIDPLDVQPPPAALAPARPRERGVVSRPIGLGAHGFGVEAHRRRPVATAH